MSWSTGQIGFKTTRQPGFLFYFLFYRSNQKTRIKKIESSKMPSIMQRSEENTWERERGASGESYIVNEVNPVPIPIYSQTLISTSRSTFSI